MFFIDNTQFIIVFYLLKVTSTSKSAWCVINEFFYLKKKNVLFSKYLDFCVFANSVDFKICDVIIDIATYWKLLLCLFLLNPTYYQNEIWSNTSVLYDIFLTCFWLNAGEWKLVSGPFMILLIAKSSHFFNSWHLHFFIHLCKKWDTGILT